MSTRQKLIFMSCLVLFLLMFGSVFASEWKETEISRFVPLPRNINIVPPSADLPKEIAAFSGRWEGIWEIGGEGSKAVLVVEEISEKVAKVIYGWSAIGTGRANYSRYKAKVTPGKIEFVSGEVRVFSFEMAEDFKTIRGAVQARRGPGVSTITMKKIEED